MKIIKRNPFFWIIFLFMSLSLILVSILFFEYHRNYNFLFTFNYSNIENMEFHKAESNINYIAISITIFSFFAGFMSNMLYNWNNNFLKKEKEIKNQYSTLKSLKVKFDLTKRNTDAIFGVLLTNGQPDFLISNLNSDNIILALDSKIKNIETQELKENLIKSDEKIELINFYLNSLKKTYFGKYLEKLNDDQKKEKEKLRGELIVKIIGAIRNLDIFLNKIECNLEKFLD